MNMTLSNRFHRFRLVLLGLAIGCLVKTAIAQDKSPPNIVFILADDMGYGDLESYGHPEAKTPHIDRLAKEGVKFTQHYANGPECSPTRTAFLTGKYQQRAGGLECAIGTGNVGRYDEAIRLAEQRRLGLPPAQSILPGALKKAGYACGVFGKWHLGYEPRFNPLEHGWDEFQGYLGGNVHYFNHRETSELHVLFRGRLPVYREGYMTRLITDDSIAFIEKHKAEPFFLYVSHECPHFPYQGPNDQDKVVTEENWTEPDGETYVKMLENLDQEVGRLLSAIDEAGVAENTVVVFVSDNGGISSVAHMAGLRGTKGTTFEGGIRVPLIVRWPNHIEPGTVSDQTSLTFDLTRSFLNIAGAETEGIQLDGMDIINHVAEDKPDVSRTLFWRGKRGDRTWRAVRAGDLKYVRKTEGNQTDEWLFHLGKDKSEENDLMKMQPEAASRLKKQLADWEREVQPVR